MKEYLKKLGRTKFQAYLLVSIINLVSFIAYLTGNLKLHDQVQEWMPAIHLLVQAIATAVYQVVEGSIDRQALKQNANVVSGSAPASTGAPQAEPPQAALPIGGKAADIKLSWAEFQPMATFVNNELSSYQDHINRGKLSDVARQAIVRYKAIHDYLQTQEPLMPIRKEGGGANATEKSG